MVTQVLKRDGKIQDFDKEKIAKAIYKAAVACNGNDKNLSDKLAEEVVSIINAKYEGKIPTVEQVQDTVEKVLIEHGHAKTAKAYILYREKRKQSHTKHFWGKDLHCYNFYDKI